MPLSGLRLAFSLPLVPSRQTRRRQARRSGRYTCQTERLLVFEQACHAYHCMILDGLWARSSRGEGELGGRFLGVEGRQCKAACPRVVATSIRYGRYALLSFGEFSKAQMASFDVGGSVDLLWSLRCAGSCIGGPCM